MDEERRERKLHEIRVAVQEFADARAERVRMETFLPARKAQLMKEALQAGVASVAAQEREALAHPDYQVLVDALAEATRIETRNYWRLRMYEMEFEKWRTMQANRREEMRRYQG